MGNMERRKGRRYELDVIAWFGEYGIPVRDTNPAGFSGGDLVVADVVSLECKNHVKLDLGGWIRQAEVDAPPGLIPAVIHKKRGTTLVADHYVSLPAWAFLALVGRAIR